MDIKTAVACPLKIPNTKILASLGRGRQTLNYQASRDNRSFALKILLGKSTLPAENDPLHTVQNLSSDILQPPAQGARDAFVREAAFSGAMRHDVLPKVFEVGER
ncbi:hypothetical protein KAI87_00610, partial [Myxococcota bacterium]|nr:hypothetical protein [Myxococcota bacterium]